MPVHILLAILAAPAVQILLGPQWDSVVPLIQIMSLAAVPTFPLVLAWPVLVAAGAVHLYMRALLIGWPMAIGTMFVAAKMGLTALAFSAIVVGLALTGPGVIYAKKALGFTWREAWAAVRKSVQLTAISMAVPLLAYVVFDPISVPMAMAVGLVAVAGWLVGLRLTEHPLLDEVDHMMAMALRVPALARLAQRLPARIRPAALTPKT